MALPVVSALNPSSGPSSGGNPVVISGSGFNGVTRVKFGATTAAFTYNSDTQITATAPAMSGGPPAVNVTVTTPQGTSAQVVLYSYLNLPVVTWVDPAVGPLAGSNTVTVHGAGLTAVTSVLFGQTAALPFSILSDTHLTAVAPPGSGSVQVTVVSPGGTSQPVPCGVYTYLGRLGVAGLNPDHGPPSGGNSVVVNGSSFTYATTVLFGAVETPFTVVSDTQIVARAPSGSGTVLVTVANALGSGSPGVPYTYR